MLLKFEGYKNLKKLIAMYILHLHCLVFQLYSAYRPKNTFAGIMKLQFIQTMNTEQKKSSFS